MFFVLNSLGYNFADDVPELSLVLVALYPILGIWFGVYVFLKVKNTLMKKISVEYNKGTVTITKADITGGYNPSDIIVIKNAEVIVKNRKTVTFKNDNKEYSVVCWGILERNNLLYYIEAQKAK